MVRLVIEENNRKAQKCTMDSAIIDLKAYIVKNKPKLDKKMKFSSEGSCTKQPRFTKNFEW